MQKDLELKLNNRKTKPIFTLTAPDNKQLICMMDTGADMPVWCGSEKLLKALYPDAQVDEHEFLLGGFGRNPEVVKIYKIPQFVIVGGGAELKFLNLYVAASFDRNFGCDLILSATMFSHMDYSVLNRRGDGATLKIVYDKETWYTSIISYNKNYHYAERVCSFASDENKANEEAANIAAAFREYYNKPDEL